MSFDRKTGKPIACAVVKLLSNALSYEILSEDQVTGTIAQEAKPSQKGKPVSITVIFTFHCMGEIFCVEFGSLKSYTII